jgi:glycosyltransferase involved in cell wall biosynthesis
MKIGFFSPTINSIGGGEWVTVNMIKSLEKRGYEIVVYSDNKIDLTRISRVFGCKLHFDEEINFGPSIFNPYEFESVYPNALKSFLFNFKCDLLIDTFSNALLPWADAVYFQGKPQVAFLPKGLKGLFFSPYKILLTSKNSRDEGKIAMACSKFSARRIEKATGLQVNVLYPPVSNFFRTKDVTSKFRKNVAVTVSRFSKEKNLEFVPQIAKLIRGDLLFIIAGRCDSKDVLDSILEPVRKLKISDRVKVIPNIARNRLRDILCTSKVYLHTRQNEPFGVSIIEAMSSGCIPVVPDSGGPREFVPGYWRYRTIEEAASVVENAVFEWSPKTAEEFVQSTNRFSQERFSSDFLRIMNL